MLVLIPFDLAIVDSSLAAVASSSGEQSGGSGGAAASPAAAAPAYPPLVGTILELCQRYLASPGSTREMAAVVVGRLLTRPDMAPALDAFLGWGCAALTGADDSQRASFLVPGALMGQGRALLGLSAGFSYPNLGGFLSKGVEHHTTSTCCIALPRRHRPCICHALQAGPALCAAGARRPRLPAR